MTKSLNIIMGDDSMSDDVFEQDDDENSTYSFASVALPPPPLPYDGPGTYSTGYRDFKAPPEVFESSYAKTRRNDSAWSCYRTDQDNPDNCVHKTILLGDSSVGKTSLLVQFDTKKFQHGSFAATVGIGFTNKMVNVDDTLVKLQIWDTAGQERFRSVTHAYYRDAHALLLLYDVTNKQSFDNIRAWLGEIREYAQDDVVIMLLGNKFDCGSERVVRREDGQRLANEYRVPFMETSAKTGLNVDLAFHAVARELKARSKKGNNKDGERFNVQDYLKEHQSQQSNSSCFSTNCLSM